MGFKKKCFLPSQGYFHDIMLQDSKVLILSNK